MSLAEIDQHHLAVDERRAQRYAQRGQPNPDDNITPLRASGRPAFEIAAPPGHARGVSPARGELIKFLRANPGVWVRYNAAGNDDASPNTIRQYIATARGGFGPGFQCKCRNTGTEHEEIYIVYSPSGDDV